ncbi:ATP-dependent DNA helicase RecG [Desulfurella amilsii]|uniref:ATP-dependent DNA helicase RecG n=1 Tax=Desulfurella amilsii TaxID=1562698 RepID=A0A1X4XXL4_9BACT|nr:ATP-dependent DNA helicase RecG [Desulfurella amilsii]OSS42280.1 ATP-dependent DNA helicase RecG [Desulfurella amilsii]
MVRIKQILNALEAKILTYTHIKDYKNANLYLKKENSLIKFDKCANWLLSKLVLKPYVEKIFNKRYIYCVLDLLLTKPLRHEHYTQITPIANAQDYACVKGTVVLKKAGNYYTITIDDGSSKLDCKWFNVNQFLKHILRNIKVGATVVCEGKITVFGQFREMHHPRIRPLSSFKPHVDIIYPSFGNLKNATVKKIIEQHLSISPKPLYDFLPYTILTRNNLPFLSEVFESIHIKSIYDERIEKRLKYDELFLMQLGLALQEQDKKNESISVDIDKDFLQKVEKKLPFELTIDQVHAINVILNDMSASQTSIRLLQGDVGSGKTIVALICALAVLKNNYQVCIMSPTTSLAEQTYAVAKRFLENEGFKVELLINTTKKKNEIFQAVKDFKIHCLVGTHALLNEKLEFNNLGFLVIDEQHRFGVDQRKMISNKGKSVYCLIMSATPIPRSLAFAIYGKTKVVEIRSMPKNRKAISTIHLYKSQEEKAFLHAREEILKKHQVYVVFALIDDSESKTDFDSLMGSFEDVKKRYFNEFDCAFLHSNVKSAEKTKIFHDFVRGKIDCLMSTTVIEVGIDNPNATIIIIENAENYGLAQLHQLRGRVGRSDLDSFCYLVTKDKISSLAKRRIDVLISTTDGFEIAKQDLILRGSGEIYSTRQHGLPDLEFADILKDRELLEKAQRDVYELLNLGYPLNDGLLKMVEHKWQRKFSFARVI